MTESNWTGPYTIDRANELHALTRRVDPAFARQSEEWWQSRTRGQLLAERANRWNCNDGDGYMLANCYLTLHPEPSAATHLPDDGRCCGRKPLLYKRDAIPAPQLFCPRCDRAYDPASGEQLANWAWHRVEGEFVPKRRGIDP